jgi:hypothetical protein
MPFKRSVPSAPVPEDPEDLYRILALTNEGPAALWSHQSDVLRSWHGDHLAASDVAIELPTGAGKTLVGGLIGEFQRRVAGERIAYLCQTRQLARQSAAMLTSYGIPNVLLIGKVASWNAADRARYSSADAVAVSVYSHVFNSNPAIDDAQMLLLDDAHGVESYVASPWSLEIARDERAYADVLSALDNALDPLVVERLRTDSPDSRYLSSVYLVSPVGVTAQAAQLEKVLAAASAAETISEQARYALKLLAGQLDRCMVYASYRRLLIRPLITPTSVHRAFSDPMRRIYMSATLGVGGELERCFGRRKIVRIPIPKGWEKQGTGRRLFCFPEVTTDLSTEPDAVDAWVAKVIADHGRALVLTPDKRTAGAFTDRRLPAGYKVLEATDVEDDLGEFTSQPAAALVVSNRYDGIDLPDDNCRLVVLDGLPARGDLQERFLYESLGALEVLQERIRARIVQGAGRATRNSRDYAAVLLLGSGLISYATRRDVQDAMRPEIHAELKFGFENSLDISSDVMIENLQLFRDHGEAWREAETDIVADRDRFDQISPPGSAELQAAAPHEVAAWEAIWQGDWAGALSHARSVLDALSGGKAPQRYAALWNYLASCLALRLARQTGDASLTAASTAFYHAARVAGRGTTWLAHLAAPAESVQAAEAPAADPLDRLAITGVLHELNSLGRPAVFDTQVTEVRSSLMGTDSRPYEAALVTLGRFAGASHSEGSGGADAAPDAIWIFNRMMWVAWEAKSEADPGGELAPRHASQAGGHLRYTEGKRAEAPPGDSVSLILTPQHRVHPAARTIAEDHVFLVHPTEVLDLFDRLVRAWRSVRARNSSSLAPADALAIFSAEEALPSQWLPKLRQRPLREMTSEAG